MCWLAGKDFEEKYRSKIYYFDEKEIVKLCFSFIFYWNRRKCGEIVMSMEQCKVKLTVDLTLVVNTGQFEAWSQHENENSE